MDAACIHVDHTAKVCPDLTNEFHSNLPSCNFIPAGVIVRLIDADRERPHRTNGRNA